MSFFEKLGQKLEITYGPLKCFLGIQIETIKGGLFLHMTNYVKQLLEKYNMTNTRYVSTPLDRSIYTPDDSKSIDDKEYRQLIGSLNFLVSTVRPDLAFSCSWLSRFLDKPTEKKWSFAMRVLRYLHGTADYGISYTRDADQTYQFYSDSDFASDPITRRSVTGMVIHSGGGCIVWKSSLQRSCTLSTCESELTALSALAQSAQFIRRLLSSLGVEIIPNLRCDNLATISLATSQSRLHAKSKHVSVKEFFVRELAEEGVITVEHISSILNFSDLMTKPHNYPTFCKLLKLINLTPLPRSISLNDHAADPDHLDQSLQQSDRRTH